MAVSRRLRYEVLRRDDHACRYCGGRAPDVSLTVDHVIPVALGGGDEPSNLVTACRVCNAGKSSSNPDAPVVASVSDDALRWAAAIRQAASLADDERYCRDLVVKQFDEVWTGWTYEVDGERRPCPRPDDWRLSVIGWWRAGLDSETLEDLISTTMPRRRINALDMWRYFCGAAWRTLEERRELAQRIIESEKAGPSE